MCLWLCFVHCVEGCVLCNPYMSFLSAPHSYMSIVESLPTYGVHYYAVKVQFYYSAFSFFSHTRTPHTFLFTLALCSLGFGDMTELKAICTLSLSLYQSHTHAHYFLRHFCCSGVFLGQAGDPMVVGSEL